TPAPDAPAAPETPVPTAIVASPLSPLPAGEGWKISILKGLPNASGNAVTGQDAFYDIGTIEPFRVTEMDALAAADQPRRIAIRFNAPLPEQVPADFLTQSILLEPRPANLTAEIDGREIHLLGDFSETDSWQLTVKPPF